MKKSVNLGEVAAASGYHKSTVSRALRNDQSIPKTTRDEIRTVADSLGYRPHPYLSTVMTLTRSRQPQRFVGDTIVWVAESSERLKAWKSAPFMEPLYSSAVRQTERMGRKLEIIPPDEFFKNGIPTTKGIASYAKMLKARGIPGVILPELTDPVLMGFPWDGFSVVSINPADPYNHTVESVPYPQVRFNRIVSDRYRNMMDLMNSLRELGYRRIGLLTDHWSDDWQSGMARAAYFLVSHDLGAEIPPMYQGDDIRNPDNFPKDLAQWVEKNQVDAIIAGHGDAKKWLENIGLSVPDDIGLAHQHLATDVEGWTGIDPDLSRIGELAVDMLCSAIQRNESGPEAFPLLINVRGQVILGNTTRSQ